MTTPNYHDAPRETSQDEDHYHVRWERRDEKEYRAPTRTIEQSQLVLLFCFLRFLNYITCTYLDTNPRKASPSLVKYTCFTKICNVWLRNEVLSKIR